ncbi:hypothetical protein M8J77_022623 [Diaphorina citri]|nr:hypothetical protein M8J77_022623 [Diaphorina citri]
MENFKALANLLKINGCKVPQVVLSKLLAGTFNVASSSADSLEIGLDSCIIPLASGRSPSPLYLIQSTDFFYPLVTHPHIMGAIACANVLSDIYAVGVTDIDALQMIVGISTQLTEDERDIIVPMLIEGFKAQASVAGVNISKVAVKLNPWMTIGGVVTSVCSSEEFVMPNQAQPGDVIILTKPLGTQMSVTIRSWLKNEEKLSFLKSIKVDSAMLKQCVNSAITLMATINKKAAILMKKYNAHACTDVTGYGLTGHATNLVKYQTNSVNFMIHTLPILYPLGVIASRPGTRFYQNVNRGHGIETSGGLFICLPEDHAKDFIKEMNGLAWIIGKVTPGDRSVIIKDSPDIFHVTLIR